MNRGIIGLLILVLVAMQVDAKTSKKKKSKKKTKKATTSQVLPAPSTTVIQQSINMQDTALLAKIVQQQDQLQKQQELLKSSLSQQWSDEVQKIKLNLQALSNNSGDSTIKFKIAELQNFNSMLDHSRLEQGKVLDSLGVQVQEMRKLNQEIQSVKSDLMKYRAQQDSLANLALIRRHQYGLDYLTWQKDHQRTLIELGSLTPQFSLKWFSMVPMPQVNLDSGSQMLDKDFGRWDTWKDQVRNEFGHYGYLHFQLENWQFNDRNDFSVTAGEGITPNPQAGFQGFYLESGYGMEMLRGYCNGSICSNSVQGDGTYDMTLAGITEVRLGWNEFLFRRFDRVDANAWYRNLALGLSGTWRGHWGIISIENGDYAYARKSIQEYFGSQSLGILGNSWELDLKLMAAF